MIQRQDLIWFDVREVGVEGKGWQDTQAFYDRLPARAERIVRPIIWELSRQPTGMCAFFATDAPEIWARWQLADPNVAWPRTPASALSGLDLYADDAGRWRWAGAARLIEMPAPEEPLLTTAAPGLRRYRVYLPIGNPVLKLEIGVPRGAQFALIPPRPEKPIVFYGTSICHGHSASRPGMTHPAILARRLDRPLINLGFNGNAHMEPEVGSLLAELDPALFVIDAIPNMPADMIYERAEPFLRNLRRARPQTPMVLVAARHYTNSWICQANRTQDIQRAMAFREVYDRLLAQGTGGLTYVPGEHLLGDDNEASVDCSHPTDLGFMRMADALEPVLRAALATAT